MRFLLDTNILSELLRNPRGQAATRIREEQDAVCTSLIVLAEIRFGLAKHPSARLLDSLEKVLESLPVEAWDHPAELRYGDLRLALEQAGTPIGPNDMLIAAHALALDATLVTANEREFRRVPGLRVENWAA